MIREMMLDCLLIIGGSAAHGRLWFNFRYVINMMGKAEMANYCFLTDSRRSWCKSGGELQNSLCRFPWQVQLDPEASKKC